MNRRTLPLAVAVTLMTAVAPLTPILGNSVAGADGGTLPYSVGTPVVDTLANGASAAPWNEWQGDPGSASYGSSRLFPTYQTGGSQADGFPNLAVYPSASSGTDGVSPYPSGTVGTPGPLAGYCGTGNQTTASSGTPARQPATTLPLAPAYFPHIVRGADGTLTGYFDERPKDADESIMVATSSDNGTDWTYQGQALEQNPGYCPSADINDDGEGHPNVLTVGGVSRLYTLQRPAGDSPGVGMLVHSVNPSAANPLSGVPATEQVGIDPDAFATAGAVVPTSGSATIAVNGTGSAGSTDQLVAGSFVDLTQNPPSASTLIRCTGVTGTSLTGCTSASGLTVNSGDLIEQIIGFASAAATVPAGPNTSTGDGGLASLSVVTAASGGTAGFTLPLTGTTYNANAPDRVYLNGTAVYCVQGNANPTTKIENCTTGPGRGALEVTAGAPITSDPVVPATATMTTGLVAPDGIVDVLPAFPNDGSVPAGATYVMYTEKELNYYVAGTTTNSASVKFNASTTIAFTPSPYTSQDLPPVISAASPVVVSMGDLTTSTIVSLTCTGLTTTPTDSLTGCTAPAANAGDQFGATSLIGAPGAAVVPPATLALLGEGSGTPPSAKNVAKLMKNNEDLSLARVAWTTDGINFSSTGLSNNGVISGNGTESGSNYDDLNSPASTTSPSNLNAYAAPGTPLATEERWVGSAGTILTTTGTGGTPLYELFLSGAWAADGDSDAFNQVYFSTSTDGQHWTVPVTVVSTDYTFSASSAQDASPGQPLGVSAYYSGRAYGPSVVPDNDGSGNLTMVFAGYRSPKPIVSAGTVLGTGATPYTVGTQDPSLYRNIMTVTLTSLPNGGATPEVPATLLLPMVAALIGGVAVLRGRRRRRGTTAA